MNRMISKLVESKHHVCGLLSQVLTPKELAQEEYRNSRSATGPLVQAISEQKRGQMHEHLAEAANIRNDLKVQKRKHQKERADIMRDQASNNMKLRRREPLAGSVFFQLRSLVSSYTREHSEMSLP